MKVEIVNHQQVLVAHFLLYSFYHKDQQDLPEVTAKEYNNLRKHLHKLHPNDDFDLDFDFDSK